MSFDGPAGPCLNGGVRRRSRTRRVVGWGVPLVLATSFGLAGCEGLELPRGPDLAQLGRAYERPDGELDQSELASVIESAQAVYDQVQELQGLEFVIDTVEQVGEAAQEFVAAESGDPLLVDLVSRTDHVCPGQRRVASSDPANGLLHFTLTIDDSVITPVVWGELQACQALSSEGLPVALDAVVELLLEGELSLARLDLQKFLFRVEGNADVDQVGVPVDLDFRVLADRTVEVRVPSAGGDVVFAFGRLAQRAAVRTRDLSYCCQFGLRRCVEVVSPSCDAERVGDRELTW